MNAKKWIGLFCMGALAVGCMWTTGCGGGSDDDDGDTTIVVTNAPAPEAAPSAAQMVAPQLVSPANGAALTTFLINTPRNVDFEWTAVPGANSYILEVNGTKYTSSSTKITKDFPIGSYKWRVWGVDANGANGPASGQNSFTVKFQLIMATNIIVQP